MRTLVLSGTDLVDGSPVRGGNDIFSSQIT
jgi:hypothetical protein